jgi:hypothetical protein
MLAYPPQVTQAAKNLLDNNDFRVLLSTRLEELKEDIVNSSEGSMILDSHAELTHVKQFAEWISHIGEDSLRKDK